MAAVGSRQGSGFKGPGSETDPKKSQEGHGTRIGAFFESSGYTMGF